MFAPKLINFLDYLMQCKKTQQKKMVKKFFPYFFHFQQARAIEASWRKAKQRMANNKPDHGTTATKSVGFSRDLDGGSRLRGCFGTLVFDRLFARQPDLRNVFAVDKDRGTTTDSPRTAAAAGKAEEEAIARHSRLVTDIIDLAVRLRFCFFLLIIFEYL
jgi:hypothetical protein